MCKLICTAVVYDKDSFKGALLAPCSEIVAKGYLNRDWEFYNVNALQTELCSGNVLFMTDSNEPFQLELTPKMIEYLHNTHHINSKKSASMFAHYTRGIVKFNYSDILRAKHNRFLHAASVTKVKKGIIGHQYLVHVWGNYTPDFQAFMSGYCPMIAVQVKSYECNHMIYTLNEDILVKLCTNTMGHKLLPYFNNCELPVLETTVADNDVNHRRYLCADMGTRISDMIDKYYIQLDELEMYGKIVLGKSVWTWSELTKQADKLEEYFATK